MTKRFKLGYVCGDFGLIDNDEWIDLHSMSENSEKNVQICINKMNELAEVNRQLNECNQKLNEKVCILQMDLCKTKSYEQLEKENEQLKKECYGNLDGLNYYQEQNGYLSSKISDLECENEQLKNKIDALEDDNETYHKSLEKLNLYTKRFIPTKCTNEFKDCKTNRYYWLDHEGNFEGCLELLNLLDCEKEVLKSENSHLKAKLIEYEEQKENDSTISRNDFNNFEKDDEKSCGHCKHLNIDGMFGMWCDKGHNWEQVIENCIDWERS